MMRLAMPWDLSSWSRSASRRVASSTPVVFNNRVIATTNTTERMSPDSEGSISQGNRRKSSPCQREHHIELRAEHPAACLRLGQWNPERQQRKMHSHHANQQ